LAEYQWLLNFGFAAVVAIYALVRLEKMMQLVARQVRLNSLLLAKMGNIDFAQLEKEYEVTCESKVLGLNITI